MDSDFMNNLANMIKSGNIPEDIKSKMNQFVNQNNGQNQDNSSNEEHNNRKHRCPN